MEIFLEKELRKLYKRVPEPKNGQVTIIGGSDLFHGAPILALKVASRVVDMVYFSSPEASMGDVAARLKSELSSFIWVPWNEIDDYIEKSDSVLIGPGMKRWHKEKDKSKLENARVFDKEGLRTQRTVARFLKKFPNKRWVIDGGALQVMDPRWITKNAIITPNEKEFKLLFGNKTCDEAAKEYKCVIMAKSPVTLVCSPEKCVEVHGGNNGLTKGGTGDVLAGLVVTLFAKNSAFLAATSASWIVKKAADELYRKVGTVYNSDDLADEIPKVLGKYLS